MKIGIMADSHDNLNAIRRALDVFRSHGVEAIVHAGDVVAPFAAKAVARFTGPVHAVFGNNDGERKGLAKVLDIVAPPRTIALGGRTILVAHDEAEVARPSPGVHVVVTGHSHEPAIVPGAPLRINPGETGGWLKGRATCVVLDLDTLQGELCELGGP